MLKALSLPLGSLLFTIVLIVVYIHKTRVAKYKNNYFLALLFLLVGVLVTEMMTYFTMMQMDIHPYLNLVVTRIHGIIDLAWTICMAAYLYSFVKINAHREDRKNNLKPFIIVFIISSFISLFLPFEYHVSGESAYLSGLALGFLYTVGFVVVIIASVLVLINQKHILFSKTFPIIVAIVETAITVPASLACPEVYIVTSSFVLKVYLIYFTLENPDLYLISELRREKKKADDSNKAKSDFLINTSNEIVTPINEILELSESLVNNPLINKEEALNNIKHIYASGGRLIEIIDNILNISHIESGETSLNEEEYNIASVILELHSLIDSRLAGSKVRFITNVDETIPVKIYGDKVKLFQILLNILSNAVKYTEIGRIELKIKGELVKDTILLHFRISDTGRGIKEKDYQKIMDEMASLNSVDSDKLEKLGLGLMLTKKLVDIMDGKIWLETRYGAGSDFYVDIVQRVVDKSHVGNLLESEAKSSNDTSYFDCSNYRVLLVDDNELNLKVAKKLLLPYQFEITTLNNGKDCIDLIKSGEEYDLIFLDHMMPGMDGIEVLHVLKSLETYKIPPIVALTANAVTGMKEMYLKEGFDDYLAKPININELNKLLTKYFKK